MEYISNEQLKLLIQLQEKDSQISEIVEKQKAIPDILASLKVNLDKAEGELTTASHEYDSASRDRRGLEGELKTAEDRVKKLKERVPELKTNKEYQALLKEISVIEKEKSEIEEKILILLEKLDGLKDITSAGEQAVREEEKQFTEKKKKIEGDFSHLSDKLKELETQKASLVASIDPRILSEYNRLIYSRKGIAVVSVQNEHCLGCHIRIPPQSFTEIRKNDKIIACLSCQRILYWKPS